MVCALNQPKGASARRGMLTSSYRHADLKVSVNQKMEYLECGSSSQEGHNLMTERNHIRLVHSQPKGYETPSSYFKRGHPEAYALLENPEEALKEDHRALEAICRKRGLLPIREAGQETEYPLCALIEHYEPL